MVNTAFKDVHQPAATTFFCLLFCLFPSYMVLTNILKRIGWYWEIHVSAKIQCGFSWKFAFEKIWLPTFLKNSNFINIQILRRFLEDIFSPAVECRVQYIPLRGSICPWCRSSCPACPRSCSWTPGWAPWRTAAFCRQKTCFSNVQEV